MSHQIRFHITDAVLSVLGGLNKPSTAEAHKVAEAQPELPRRLWSRVRAPGLVGRQHADGHISNSDPPAEVGRILFGVASM
jgi:hypothetical protein